MSELVSQPSVEIEHEFPFGAPIKGKVYAFDHNYRIGPLDDPAGDRKVRIIVMSEASWAEFGTRQESMRQMLRAQDNKIKTMAAEGSARERVNADLLSRLDALRAIRRAEKRPEVEADMNLPTKGN